MSKYQEYSLEELITYISRGITPKYTEEVNNSAIIINQKCIRDFQINFEPSRRNNLTQRIISEEKKVKLFDILINSTGVGTLGRVAQFLDDKIKEIISADTHVTIVRPDIKKINPLFLGYLVKSKQSEIESFGIGSTGQTELSRDALKSIRFNVPTDRNRQKEIAEFFLQIDQKIQLNTQINQTLEQIAQALFKSWFVDFDPMRAKVQALSDGLSLEQAELAAMQAISGKTPEELTALSQTQPERYAELAETAKAFPCEMVEVDGVEVPKGWEVKRIDEIANIIKGKSYKSSELEKSKTALVTLKSFNRGGGYRLDGLKEYTGKYKSEQEVFSGELIIAYTDVTQAADVIGKPAMVMSDSNYQHLVISLDVGVVRPFNDVYKHFLYCLAMTDSFQAHTKSFCTGTTVLHLGKDAVPSFEFINPSNELLHVFYKQTSPIFEKINLHIEENKNLEKVRDLLLPSLLSGRS